MCTWSKYFLYKNSNERWPNSCDDLKEEILTQDSHGMVLMDIVVESNSYDPKFKELSPVRIARRSLQRPWNMLLLCLSWFL